MYELLLDAAGYAALGSPAVFLVHALKNAQLGPDAENFVAKYILTTAYGENHDLPEGPISVEDVQFYDDLVTGVVEGEEITVRF